MADYPTGLPTYRPIENRPQVEFDASKTNVLYMEDIQKLRDETTAIMETVGTEDPAPDDPVLARLNTLTTQINDLQTTQAQLEADVDNLTPRVGRHLITDEDVNPGTYLPGTWEKTGQGRTLFGVDINNAAFDTVGKTGGSNEFSNIHQHVQTVGSDSNNVYLLRGGDKPHGDIIESGIARHLVSGNPQSNTSVRIDRTYSAQSSSQNITPTYLTVYFWKRVS